MNFYTPLHNLILYIHCIVRKEALEAIVQHLEVAVEEGCVQQWNNQKLDLRRMQMKKHVHTEARKLLKG